jgi:hypothetical protein
VNNRERTAPSPEKIHWHPAFFQAIQLELADYRDILEFKYEYQLTSEPLRVDTLITGAYEVPYGCPGVSD